MGMTFLGWTMKQLGAAKKHFSQVTGEDVDPTLAGAMRVKSWWQSRRIVPCKVAMSNNLEMINAEHREKN